ncbi:bifunctional DNA-formamidopyrimidine glycosylase/DNA-(apurinic or apyrimidinic site) lyase [Candidatus Giovannonibacteria bacterium]|nr:bifunctional DNA-formamidopyrimidine glycosylase/DNA-(apurinic or apyrimidinic site) lyase [Candidatus Giovannonibacteria bacterium]
MPELPEVEITTRKLEPLLIGKRILNFWTDWPRGLKMSSAMSNIRGLTIRKVFRRGKVIFLELSKGYLLAFHQRMSGKLLVVTKNIQDKHIHHRFDISKSRALIFHDVRKFGVVWFGKEKEILKDKFLSGLGHDPLTLSFKDFKKSLAPFKGAIKPLLLRQDVLSGIGNIIADESLWHARVYPKRRRENLSESELKKLYSSIRFVLRKSIRLGGTTMRDWLHPDNSKGRYYARRFVYKRAGEPCSHCGTLVKRIKIGSRGTFICEQCQSEK